MKFNITDKTFTAVKDRNGSIQTATILGSIDREGGTREHYLDRLLYIPDNEVPEGWGVDGVVSSVITEIL